MLEERRLKDPPTTGKSRQVLFICLLLALAIATFLHRDAIATRLGQGFTRTADSIKEGLTTVVRDPAEKYRKPWQHQG